MLGADTGDAAQFNIGQTSCMNDIDLLIRSVRTWRRHRPDWTPFAGQKIEARLRQQSVPCAPETDRGDVVGDCAFDVEIRSGPSGDS